MSICSLQTYDKASASKLSNYPVRNQSFFHSPLRYVLALPPDIVILSVSKESRYMQIVTLTSPLVH